MPVTSGFLVVKRFEALYQTFAADARFDNAIYALPVFGTSPTRLTVRYRGLDRKALLQGLIAALSGVDTAQAGAKAALVDWDEAEAKSGPIFQALKQTLRTMYSNAPDTLAVFALKPRKARTPLTAAQRAAAVAKGEATRAARGTKGSKQKAQVTGNVTGVTITPITIPVATPPAEQPVVAQPVSPPVAAPQAAAQLATTASK